MTLLAGTNFALHSAGWLEGGLVSSYEKFMIDIDQLGMQQRFAEGIDLSETGQALDAIAEVGPGSHYLGCAHTQANFQQAFYRSSLADNNSYEQWLAEGEKRIEERARMLCRSWLDSYVAPDLPGERPGNRCGVARIHGHAQGFDAGRLHLNTAR